KLSIDHINANIASLNEPKNLFDEQFNLISAVFEEIIFLSHFYQPIKTVEEIFQEQLPFYKEQGGDFFAFNSFMSCIHYVIQAVRSELPHSLESSSFPRVFFEKGAYFEITGSLGSAITKSGWTQEKTDKGNADLYVADLYPNDMTLEESTENTIVQSVIEIVEARRNRNAIKPLTVILDTSTTLLDHEKVKEIKNQLGNFIEGGQLNLILITSLAKFYSCALDKYAGGFCICFSTPQMKNLPIKLKRFKDQDPMSMEAKKFFSLMVHSASNEIKEFYYSSLFSTNYFYDYFSTKALEGDAQIKLQKRHSFIPIIALKYHGEREVKTFVKQARTLNLALFERSSFPFIHSGITAFKSSNATHVRLIIGIDVLSRMEAYAKVFFS
ncbi:MAG: hypothetical protein KC506_03045, partial [Nanoarchaeota archaeon]|nr:hypothetical protein [Nanoarchaeota archaeon]